MLEGDNSTVSELFAVLCKIPKSWKVLSCDKSAAGLEAHSTCIVEIRRQHSRLKQSTSEIPDVRRFEHDFGFQSRHHTCCVFNVCCLVVVIPSQVYPTVTVDPSCCALVMRFLMRFLMRAFSLISSNM